ncbi:hypothetical protein ESZ53_06020 [Salinibacterium sp. UTAS2018]|uniref:hypothetical protein n=1 Tax=Salinibacterium sp. UTAS2018 TaxID=2508880 RepID=UPI00100956E3|nr:hypothetical protein [Salinibacterium sp. UTAS2018]QAV70028.1 hypothetical protein ESZ53_06020 [Salinibacterium sp. UTAS2018]
MAVDNSSSRISKDRAGLLLTFYAERIKKLDYPKVYAAEEEAWGWSFFYDDTRLHAPDELTVESEGESITVGASESDDGLMVWLGRTASIPRCDECSENSEFCSHFEGRDSE